jgi:hypothetical protein
MNDSAVIFAIYSCMPRPLGPPQTEFCVPYLRLVSGDALLGAFVLNPTTLFPQTDSRSQSHLAVIYLPALQQRLCFSPNSYFFLMGLGTTVGPRSAVGGLLAWLLDALLPNI